MVQYENMCAGTFLSRPNRFVAMVELEGQVLRCHVKNTGRCRELLVPGTRVWCQRHNDPKRKTACSLITVEKEHHLVNIDSQVPNTLAAQWVQNGGLGSIPENLRREFTLGDSRFDLQFSLNSHSWLMEVKGVTLEEEGIARFPDAPTVRGLKHLRGLTAARENGWHSAVLFVIQMDGILMLRPSWKTDPDFSGALRQAQQAGVDILAVCCEVTPCSIKITHTVPVELTPGL